MDNKNEELNIAQIPKVKMSDNMKIEHRDAKGNLISSQTLENLITSAGKAAVASRINGSGAEAVFNYMAIGIGAVAANVADTALGSEITTFGGQRVVATVSRITTAVANDTAQFVNTFSFTGGFAITEAGILNAAAAGSLLARRVFGAINVLSGDSITITWQIQVA